MDHMYLDQKSHDAFAKTPNGFESHVSSMEEKHQAPPPYSKPPSIVSSADKPQSSEESSLSAPAAHQSALAVPSRKLEIQYKHWKNCGVRILDSATDAELYTMKTSLHKPHMIFHSTATNAVMGTATFRTLSCDVDTVVHGAPLKLTGHGFTRSRYTYDSPALDGATVTWKMKSYGFSIEFECLDEQRGATLARFRCKNCSLRKLGTLDLMSPVADNEAAVEEIVLTSSALAELLLSVRGVF